MCDFVDGFVAALACSFFPFSEKNGAKMGDPTRHRGCCFATVLGVVLELVWVPLGSGFGAVLGVWVGRFGAVFRPLEAPFSAPAQETREGRS